MRRRKERPITLCPKCNQIKIEGRMLAGLGWTICECDKPLEINGSQQIKKQDEQPFVFKPE